MLTYLKAARRKVPNLQGQSDRNLTFDILISILQDRHFGATSEGFGEAAPKKKKYSFFPRHSMTLIPDVFPGRGVCFVQHQLLGLLQPYLGLGHRLMRFPRRPPLQKRSETLLSENEVCSPL